MRKTARLFGFLGLATVALVTAALAAAALRPELGRGALRLALFGAPLLELRAPARGQILIQGGVDVFVRFPDADRVAADTFRCLLNGRDVTDELTRGENGAAGSIIGAHEGENQLRVEVFGQSAWLGAWLGDYLEDSEEVTFRVRPFPNLDRA